MRKTCSILLAGTLVLGSYGVLQGATLKNRWSFNEPGGQTTAVDSVGGKTATLMNGAYFDGSGSVWLNTPNLPSSDPSGDYVALPPNIITGYTAITIEVWYTPFVTAFWSRVWDFGNSLNNSGGSTSYFFMRTGDANGGVLGDITIMVPARNTQQVPGPVVTAGSETHLVWTSDGNTGVARIYVNGQLGGETLGFTNTPAMIGETTNNWLGRSQWGADPYPNLSYNEFRIWDGALNPLEVAASYVSGPDTVNTDPGTLNSIEVQLPSALTKGSGANARVLARMSRIPFAVDVTGMPGLSYRSSNTDVVTVDAAGRIRAVALGTATITVEFTYGGQTRSAQQDVTVLNLEPILIHRYSFNDDGSSVAVDSVGGAHGTIQIAAEQRDGQAILYGTALSYVELPANLITPQTITRNAITFEAWATFGPNANWARLFDFGNTVGSDGGNYVFFCPRSGGNDSRFIISNTQPGWSGNGEQGVYIPTIMDNWTNVHIVAILDFGRDLAAVYTNGRLAGLNTSMTRELSAIINNYSYLGRSLYGADPYLNGMIDEFRIWDGALSAQQIVASYRAGPNSTNNAPGQFISLDIEVPARITAEWQARARVIGNWQNAPNVDLLADPDLTLTSDNPDILTVGSGGLLTAVAPGTATLRARYQGLEATKQVQVVAPSATLVHRWTFNETEGNRVEDVVGGAHGYITYATNTLGVTNAYWTGAGELVINTNAALGATDAYIDLPDGIISKLTNNATFETWVTIYNGDYWSRVFDFGSLPGGPTWTAEPNIFFARGAQFNWVSGSIGGAALPTGTKVHLVVLFNESEKQAKYYVNGVLAAMSQPGAVNLSLSQINDTNNWLGRSLYSEPMPTPWRDPYLQAAYDEFRIYSGLLSEAQILANYAVGPNPPAQAPTLAARIQGNQLILSWPSSATGFTLHSTTSLGAGATWSPVSGTPTLVGDHYELAVPLADAPQRYFRLQR
ncbi:hypothetical protein G4L39_06260 [Limisphaera ngatamarikiensis]|uniref:BIG2 domain-containing protein n=2 Tax=Limisphaera ngatamarikiensis TaxID=1324935 RepID=A0A6M1RN64_9BACT|nr:LamG-like jellyroll fold domain-containing protein [Limisphaera ngatamarikiensis]NGO38999.1 hypothetical protein [Limisphaera ngatamarikiensis]